VLSGCIHDARDGVKLLGTGAKDFNTLVYVTPSRASQAAIKAIEKAGGAVVCQYHNALALRDCLKGDTTRADAAPTRREDIMWYGRHHNRGYLSQRHLETVGNLPFVEERWKLLSKQLGSWKKQKFAVEK
jgi:large subunit ribosomal protein L15